MDNVEFDLKLIPQSWYKTKKSIVAQFFWFKSLYKTRKSIVILFFDIKVSIKTEKYNSSTIFVTFTFYAGKKKKTFQLVCRQNSKVGQMKKRREYMFM